MKKLTKIIVGAIASLAIALAGVALSTPPASAGTYCNKTGDCGQVINKVNEYKRSVVISDGWDPKKKEGAGEKRVLNPGQDSKIYFKDTDGVFIPKGFRGKLTKQAKGKATRTSWLKGNKWHKLRDAETWRILLVKS